jgi:hypothetical protein
MKSLFLFRLNTDYFSTQSVKVNLSMLLTYKFRDFITFTTELTGFYVIYFSNPLIFCLDSFNVTPYYNMG